MTQKQAGLEIFLRPPGQVATIGSERGVLRPEGVSKLVSPHGSTRFVYSVDGAPVAVLQVVSRDGKAASIANVYTDPDYRRQGLAKVLLREARRVFRQVTHSEHLSEEGRGWSQHVKSAQVRTAARGTYWHGTSSKYLREILKIGILPDPKEKQYEEEVGYHRSLQTFGGAYLTDNWMTAYGFASDAKRKKGGHRVILGATYETRTPDAIPDEDDLLPYLVQVSGIGSVGDLTDLRSFWGMAFRYKDLLDFNHAGEFDPGNYPQIVEVVNNQDLGRPVQKFWDLVLQDFPRLKGRLGQRTKLDLLIEDLLRADVFTFLKQHALYYQKALRKRLQETQERMEEFYPDPQKRLKRQIALDQSFRQIVSHPQEFRGAFPRLVKATEALSRALKELTSVREHSFRHNLRVLSPITYGGKNRILLVAELIPRASETNTRTSGFTDIVFRFVRDSSLANTFLEKYERNIGLAFRVLDSGGKAIRHALPPNTTWPEDLWGPKNGVRLAIASKKHVLLTRRVLRAFISNPVIALRNYPNISEHV